MWRLRRLGRRQRRRSVTCGSTITRRCGGSLGGWYAMTVVKEDAARSIRRSASARTAWTAAAPSRWESLQRLSDGRHVPTHMMYHDGRREQFGAHHGADRGGA